MRKLDDATFECVYKPKIIGQYVIIVTYGGHSIRESPFKVYVGPSKETMIQPHDPDLESGVVGHAACFTIDSKRETDTLGLKFISIFCTRNLGLANVKLRPN